MSEARYRVEERLGIRGDLTSEARREMARAEADRWVGAPLIVTHYFPEALARRPQVGEVQELSWEWLRRWTQNPAWLPEDKAAAGGFVMADLDAGVRRKSAVRSVSCIVIDYDAGFVTPQDGSRYLARWTHILHTTWSCSVGEGNRRWRAYIQTSRPMTVAEHALVWEWVRTELAAVPLDSATRDPCRLWYSPALRLPGAPWVWRAVDAQPIDVDAVLSIPKPEPVIVELPPVKHRDRYARRAIELERQKVLSASPGGRHEAMVDASYALSRLIPAHECMSELLPAFVSVAGPGRKTEGVAAVVSAYKKRGK